MEPEKLKIAIRLGLAELRLAKDSKEFWQGKVSSRNPQAFLMLAYAERDEADAKARLKRIMREARES